MRAEHLKFCCSFTLFKDPPFLQICPLIISLFAGFGSNRVVCVAICICHIPLRETLSLSYLTLLPLRFFQQYFQLSQQSLFPLFFSALWLGYYLSSLHSFLLFAFLLPFIYALSLLLLLVACDEHCSSGRGGHRQAERRKGEKGESRWKEERVLVEKVTDERSRLNFASLSANGAVFAIYSFPKTFLYFPRFGSDFRSIYP